MQKSPVAVQADKRPAVALYRRNKVGYRPSFTLLARKFILSFGVGAPPDGENEPAAEFGIQPVKRLYRRIQRRLILGHARSRGSVMIGKAADFDIADAVSEIKLLKMPLKLPYSLGRRQKGGNGYQCMSVEHSRVIGLQPEQSAGCYVLQRYFFNAAAHYLPKRQPQQQSERYITHQHTRRKCGCKRHDRLHYKEKPAP